MTWLVSRLVDRLDSVPVDKACSGLKAQQRCRLAGRPSIGKGPLVARKRPTASNDRPLRSGVVAVRPISDISDGPLLTRSEAHALARSTPLSGAPLTPEQFRTRGREAEQGISPLRSR